MTTIGTPNETAKGENRVAMTPASARDLQKLGFDCIVQSGAGKAARFSDAAYREAGVTVVKTVGELWEQADVVAKVQRPTAAEAKRFRAGQTVISFVYPSEATKLMETAQAANSTLIAMDMVPRISRAQKMDALSSTANIAGYRAVIEASNAFGRFFTGQITAAGKVPPAKVLVIGAGRSRSGSHRYGSVARCHRTRLRRAPRSGRADRKHGRRFPYARFRGIRLW